MLSTETRGRSDYGLLCLEPVFFWFTTKKGSREDKIKMTKLAGSFMYRVETDKEKKTLSRCGKFTYIVHKLSYESDRTWAKNDYDSGSRSSAKE
jgi:hypothetical protein